MSYNRRKNRFTVAFYNVENLFDTIDNPKTFDDSFTPNSRLQWNKKKYYHKLKKVTSVISKIGTNNSAYPPAIIGLAEVENSRVVNDLVTHKNLSKFNYDYVHYDSHDERGVDVALLYNKDFFEVISSTSYPLILSEENGVTDYSRDLLVVKGNLHKEIVYVLVNHWPSRREGEILTTENRIKAAKLAQKVMQDIKTKDNTAKFIVMGDFNDNPTNESVQDYLVTTDLYNPMLSLYKKGKGTSTHKRKWYLFDQIIFSRDFFDLEKSKLTFLVAKIFNSDQLKVYGGSYKGHPFRTFVGPKYKGGFSDHFPVYIIFEKEV